MHLGSPFEKRVRVYDPEQVTSRRGGQPEVDPADVGLRRKDVDAIWKGAVKLYRTGLYPAVALCLRRRGQVVIDRAIGHARGNAPGDRPETPKEPATPDTLYCLFSASKMITAMLVHLMDQRRLLHIDDPVAHYIPEFARHGKEWVTIRHVLTHRAGIPTITRDLADIDLLEDPDRILSLICDTKPTWRPGRRLAYHALTGGYVLAGIIERVAGKPVRQVLQDEIAAPLGLADFDFGVPEEKLQRVAENALTGPPLLPPATQLLRRALGVDFRDAVSGSNDRRFQTAVVPAGNVYTTPAQATRFMQMLLSGGELDNVEIFEPRTIRRAVAEQSYLEMDFTLGVPVRYGMGFMLGSEYVSVYGRRTEHAFGHLGFTNVVLMADPERDITVSLMTTGKPFVAPGVLRWLSLLQRIGRRMPRDWGR